jgi:hypothetical protein
MAITCHSELLARPDPPRTGGILSMLAVAHRAKYINTNKRKKNYLVCSQLSRAR